MDPWKLPDVSVLAAPVYLSLIALEVWAIRGGRAAGRYGGRDARTSILMGAGSVVTGALTVGLGAWLLSWCWEHRLASLPVSAATIALCFVLGDFKFYWGHRLAHRSRWFWANHVVHHSSTHFNLSTALRQPWTAEVTGLVALSVPLVFVGFHPGVVAFVGSANLVYQFWIHTESVERLPRWFEAVMNTPSHHRVHHANNPRYLDANYAGTFIVWDRLFGSFVPEQTEEPVRYGLVHDIHSYNPLRVAFHEYVALARDAVRSDVGWRERVLYVFAPPGWSHDGSRDTSTRLKRAYVARHPAAAGRPGLPDAA